MLTTPVVAMVVLRFHECLGEVSGGRPDVPCGDIVKLMKGTKIIWFSSYVVSAHGMPTSITS